MYTGSLFSYLCSMGVKIPAVSKISGDAAGGLVVVKAFNDGFAGGFFPSAEEYAISVEPDKVLKALRAIMEACSSRLGIILVSEDRQDILTMLQNRLKDEKNITVLDVDGYSGAGLGNTLSEYLLKVRAYAGNTLSAAESHPVVYSSLELLRACDALTGEKPVTRALVYCGGEVASPGFYDIPVGTRYSDVVEACSPLLPAGDYAVLTGTLSYSNSQYGIETDISASVQKDTEKLIVLPLNHPLIKKAETHLTTMLKRISSVCNQCRLCTDMCPVYLNGGALYPHLIVRDVSEGKAAESPWIAGADLCISCNVCTAVCPAGISPMQINEFIKGVIHEAGGVAGEFVSAGVDRTRAPSGNPGIPGTTGEAISDSVRYRRLPSEKLAERFGLAGYTGRDWMPAVHTIDNISVAEIMLKQAGTAARPVVNEGDRIAVGTLIASGSENGEPSLHASISGKLSVVDEQRIVIVSAGE